MELCFKTLGEILKELEELLMIPLGYYILSELFIELLECVNYLHKHNIIHRNLRPSKVLITYGLDGRFIKLGGFYLSKFHKLDVRFPDYETKWCGSIRYIAPEVLMSGKYDTKADIFNLGVIVRELFDLYNRKQIFKQVKSMLEMKFSSLEELCSRMISTQKQLRPSCDEILSEKESWSLNSIEIRESALKQFKSLPKQSFLYLFIKTKGKSEKEIHVTKGNEFKSINNSIHYLNKTFKVLGIDFEQNINNEEMLKESESEEKVEEITETFKAFKNLNKSPQFESNLPTKWPIAKQNSRNKTELDVFECESSINTG
jgi:serine/threonine protein kinase